MGQPNEAKSVIEPQNVEWQAAAIARCKQQSYCANYYGATWRFRVPKAERFTKQPGQCLCEVHAHRDVAIECDLIVGLDRSSPDSNDQHR